EAPARRTRRFRAPGKRVLAAAVARAICSGESLFMGFRRGLLWFSLFIVFTFCFVVLFEYGPRDFGSGVQKECVRVKSFVVKQAEKITKPKKNRRCASH